MRDEGRDGASAGAPNSVKRAGQLGHLGRFVREGIEMAHLRHLGHVLAHEEQRVRRLDHRRKVEVLDLLLHLRLAQAIFRVPLQHGEDVEPDDRVVAEDERDRRHQVAKGRAPRVRHEELRAADTARLLLGNERHIPALARFGLRLDDLQDDVERGEAGALLARREAPQPAHAHARVHAAQGGIQHFVGDRPRPRTGDPFGLSATFGIPPWSGTQVV